MPESIEPNNKSRRGFLTGAAAGAAGLIAIPPVAFAQQVDGSAATVEVSTPQRPGSDFMVDVIKSLGFEYCRRQSRLQLPRPPRIADQLRRQQGSRIAHLLP